jgi:N-acetylglutamate synthase-like GNAT family acetyltransferase
VRRKNEDMLNRNVVLRPATQNDWPAIASLLEANQLPLDGAREHLSGFLLATRDGEIVGCAGAEVYAEVALLRSVAVAPALYRQGVGKMLVTRLLQEAPRHKVSTFYLLTDTAPDYFAQFGFRREPIARAPQALKASAEFQGACPASAAFMSLSLASAPAGPR